MKGSWLASLVPAVLAGTSVSAAEQAPAVPAFGEQLVQVLGGLALVLLLVVVLAWLARRLDGARFAAGARNLRLVGGIQGTAPDEGETGENFSRRLAQLMGKGGQ